MTIALDLVHKCGLVMRSFESVSSSRFSFSLLFIYLFIYCLFRAAFAAYGSFQARGPIRAAAASHTTATAMRDPSRICDLHHSSEQCWILNPLSEARD